MSPMAMKPGHHRRLNEAARMVAHRLGSILDGIRRRARLINITLRYRCRALHHGVIIAGIALSLDGIVLLIFI